MGSGFWSIMLYLQEPLETGPSTGVGKESRYAVYAPNDYLSRVRRRRRSPQNLPLRRRGELEGEEHGSISSVK